ncbi:OmpA family protein [Aquipuribacter hungaricus]|uniref:OmpA family protein n=1 Tax=Aquipuribacter hungaricus TaxID=545624 RepID=A0ABV7WIR8_9MICO
MINNHAARRAPGVRRAVRTGGALLAVALVGTAGAATASSPAPSDDGPTGPRPAGETLTSAEGVEVPVHGVVQYPAADGSDTPTQVTAAVHGVQRVDGATVLYWSAGTRDPEGVNNAALGKRSYQPVRSWVVVNWTGYAVLSDPARLTGYDGSTVDGQTNLSSPASAFPPDETGTMWVMFQVFPELDASTTTVDVTLGTGHTITDVPVGEGPLTPALPADEPIALGDGWPEVDASLLSADATPEASIFPLASTRVAVDGSATIVEETEEVRVELAADVLFPVDSADLGPEAVARLQELATTISADATGGPLGIVGHTDSDAGTDYNLDLSQRRAQAVADVLLPLLQVDGLQPSVEGRGEAEPVQPNSTPEGKQANRRVTVSYVPAPTTEAAP